MMLGVDEEVYSHFSYSDSDKQIWKKLRAAFEDKGILRGVGLLTQIVSITLADCPTTSNYVSQIMTTAQKLKGTKVEHLDHLVAAIMLCGLPPEYKPMVMSLESLNADVTVDLVKSKHLQ